MEGELVTSTTPDLVRLHGFFCEGLKTQPAKSVASKLVDARSPTPQSSHFCDAALILHGLGGNFYGSRLNLRLAEKLQQMGLATVLGNTRGHDGLNTSTVGGRALTRGAAIEIVDECRHDVQGWINWLTKRGFRRILLVGHSLGAIKSLYAQAHQPDRHVKGIVGLSATRLSHLAFLASTGKDKFLGWFQRATHLVQNDQAQELLDVDFPFPTTISAGAYVDKYGPQDRYNWMRFVGHIETPVLLMFGEDELANNPAFQGLLEDAQQLLGPYPNYDLQVIPRADHFYAGAHSVACDAMQAWIGKQTL